MGLEGDAGGRAGSEEEQGREPLHHGRLPVCVVPSAHTLLSPWFPYPLDWFSILAHQGVMESLVSGWMEVQPLLTAPAGTRFGPFKEP